MRLCWVTALFALLLIAGTSLPAQRPAPAIRSREKDIADRAEAGRMTAASSSASAWRGLRPATRDEDYEARPRQRYEPSDDDRPRYTKRRHARQSQARKAAPPRRAPRRAQASRIVTVAGNAAPTRRRGRARSLARDGSRRLRQAASLRTTGRRSALLPARWFNPDGMTAAHRTLPFGTRVRVTHAATAAPSTCVINDRGPFIAGRIIDLSRGAAGRDRHDRTGHRPGERHHSRSLKHLHCRNAKRRTLMRPPFFFQVPTCGAMAADPVSPVLDQPLHDVRSWPRAATRS